MHTLPARPCLMPARPWRKAPARTRRAPLLHDDGQGAAGLEWERLAALLVGDGVEARAHGAARGRVLAAELQGSGNPLRQHSGGGHGGQGGRRSRLTRPCYSRCSRQARYMLAMLQVNPC